MNQVSFIFTFLVLLILFSGCGNDIPSDISAAIDELPEDIDFNFHVRPILSDRCYSCHGPDENSRQADLRLDIPEEAYANLKSGAGRAIVRGAPANSELIKRIITDDPEIIMPTPTSNLSLSIKEKAILYKWVEQGAEWKDHWAFLPISKTPIKMDEVPEGGNEIDYFIEQRLSQEGLSPSNPATKERLIRRVTMDLTGLPPTISAIDKFFSDDSDDAYEIVVDQLLNSKAFAERLATEWLDVSRYADSHGIHADGARRMWPWRDWVIDAFASNMPYDQFGTWQLAGDLLPDATREQKLATAFNRNHTMTGEGGAIDEEYRLGYVFDRAETTATAFLGLTTMCAKCHDHKFDPISQKEYFEMTAFFNNVREIGMTGDDGDYGPMLSLADEETLSQMTSLQNEIAQLESELAATDVSDLKAYLTESELPPDDAVASVSYERIDKRSGANDYRIDKNNNIRGNTENKLEEGISGKAQRRSHYSELLERRIIFGEDGIGF